MKKVTEVLPSAAPLLIPIRINPTCAMEEKARNRLIFCWRMANKFPMIMVASAKMIRILYHTLLSGCNTLYNAAIKINAIDTLDTTERKEVTAIGEPSYTSAVHK